MQASTKAQATAVENLSNQTTNQVANASSSARATSYSITPLPPTTQCIRFENTNYSGDLLYFVFGILSADACCDLCTRQRGCNVYVYCPRALGCNDGAGRIYPGSLCTLKYQRLAAGTSASSYGAGPNVPWTSGIVTTTSLGYCIGYAEAAASAQATAGCGSVAYAVAVATAVDSCGNTAAAQALSVAVGGQCPVTCESSIQNVRTAASANGCGSSPYNEAVDTASALCGAARFAELSSGICPAPDCGTAVAQASASASAGCDTIAYSSALAVAQTACASAFASAAATAIGGKCPIDCPSAVQAASAAARASGCNSSAFGAAQATGILICGADSYASAAATVSGGICTIGDKPAVDDAPAPAAELPIQPPLEPIVGPTTTPGAEIPVVVFPSAPAPSPEISELAQVLVIPGVLPGAPPTIEPTLAILATPTMEPATETLPVRQQQVILPVNVPAPEAELRTTATATPPAPETITTVSILPAILQAPVSAPVSEQGTATITQSGTVILSPPAPESSGTTAAERTTRAPSPEQAAATTAPTTVTTAPRAEASSPPPPPFSISGPQAPRSEGSG